MNQLHGIYFMVFLTPPTPYFRIKAVNPLTNQLLVQQNFMAEVTFTYLVALTLLLRGRQWHPTTVLLPGKSHGRSSMVGCSPWGHEESDTTERLHFQFSLPCFGEGNGNPLQCSCLENPRDEGAWWAVYGVAQSQTRQKRRSSSRWLIKDILEPVWPPHVKS